MLIFCKSHRLLGVYFCFSFRFFTITFIFISFKVNIETVGKAVHNYAITDHIGTAIIYGQIIDLITGEVLTVSYARIGYHRHPEITVEKIDQIS